LLCWNLEKTEDQNEVQVMSTFQQSALNRFLNQTLNKSSLVLVTALLFATAGISNADNSAATGNMPASDAQEMLVEENPKSKIPAEKTQGKVARAIFTSEIIDREPANDLTNMDNTSGRIYFFTDLRNLTGQIVTHRWEYNDVVMAEIKFKVGGGSRWRVYSSKNLLPEWTGTWTVFVTDENEQTLNTSIFNYTQATAEATAVTDPAVEQTQQTQE
jgi:hypothetical protein